MARPNAVKAPVPASAPKNDGNIEENAKDESLAKPTPDKVKRVTKEIFDKVGDLNPEIYPFKVAVPEGFDFKIHANLKKKDYIGDHLYFEMRAVGAELAVIAFRELAVEAEKMGSTKDRAKAKKLVKMTSKLSELKQQLIAVMGEDAVNKMLEVSENDD